MRKSILIEISLLCGFLGFFIQANACPDLHMQIHCSGTNCRDLNLSYGACPTGLSLQNASATNVTLKIPLKTNNYNHCQSSCNNVVIKRGNSSDFCSMQSIDSSYQPNPPYPQPKPQIRIDVTYGVNGSGNFNCKIDPNNNANTALHIQPK